MHWLNILQVHNFHQTELRLQQKQTTQAQATDTHTTQIHQQAGNDDLEPTAGSQQVGSDDLQPTTGSQQVGNDDPHASNDDIQPTTGSQQAGNDDLQPTSISSLVEEKIGIIGSTVGGESVRTDEEKLATLQ